jgi:CDP-archaeol synthase
MHWTAVAQALLLIAVSNSAPVVVSKLFGKKFSRPLDGGALFLDGKPVFGPSKTLRGIIASILLTTAAAPLIGLSLLLGVGAAVAAMIGDLMSSFVKRRLGMPPSSRATGLDQIPESLLPALTCAPPLNLTFEDVASIIAIFLVGEIILSKILFKWRLRSQPY